MIHSLNILLHQSSEDDYDDSTSDVSLSLWNMLNNSRKKISKRGNLSLNNYFKVGNYANIITLGLRGYVEDWEILSDDQ